MRDVGKPREIASKYCTALEIRNLIGRNQIQSSYKVHWNKFRDGELSDPLCDSQIEPFGKLYIDNFDWMKYLPQPIGRLSQDFSNDHYRRDQLEYILN